jgi:hypothetical protein
MKASKSIIRLPIFILVIAMAFACSPERPGELTGDIPGPRAEILFDFGWKFHRGDIDGAEAKDFNDATWRIIDLPHDYSIEDIPGTNSPMIIALRTFPVPVHRLIQRLSEE